jgi:hypothetical protein
LCLGAKVTQCFVCAGGWLPQTVGLFARRWDRVTNEPEGDE